MRISDYELVDHDIKHTQYFKGCGTSFTKFDHIVTGIGDNPAEAIEDCFEQIAQQHTGIDFDEFEARIKADEGITEFPVKPSVSDVLDLEEDEASDCYYYVSIRYNLEK